MTTPTPDTRPSVEAAAERFNRYLAGDSLYAIYQEMPREKTYEKLDMDQATLANAYLAQSPTYAQLCVDYTKTSMECIDLSREVARLEAECNHDRLFARTVLSSMHWTGDGYEWTGGRFDYRMEPATAAALTAGEIESLREENKNLTTDLAVARAEVERLKANGKLPESSGIIALTDENLDYIACEVSHDLREDPKRIDRVRWNNMAMGSAIKAISELKANLAAFDDVTKLTPEIVMERLPANVVRNGKPINEHLSHPKGHSLNWFWHQNEFYLFLNGGGIVISRLTTGDLLKLLSAIGGAK